MPSSGNLVKVQGMGVQQQKNDHSGVPRFEPGAAGWEAHSGWLDEWRNVKLGFIFQSSVKSSSAPESWSMSAAPMARPTTTSAFSTSKPASRVRTSAWLTTGLATEKTSSTSSPKTTPSAPKTATGMASFKRAQLRKMPRKSWSLPGSVVKLSE